VTKKRWIKAEVHERPPAEIFGYKRDQDAQFKPAIFTLTCNPDPKIWPGIGVLLFYFQTSMMF
jgi:hypothetical protein